MPCGQMVSLFLNYRQLVNFCQYPFQFCKNLLEARIFPINHVSHVGVVGMQGFFKVTGGQQTESSGLGKVISKPCAAGVEALFEFHHA